MNTPQTGFRLETLLREFVERFGLINTAILAGAMLLLGLIVIIHPVVLAWIVGVACLLAAVAMVTTLLTREP